MGVGEQLCDLMQQMIQPIPDPINGKASVRVHITDCFLLTAGSVPVYWVWALANDEPKRMCRVKNLACAF